MSEAPDADVVDLSFCRRKSSQRSAAMIDWFVLLMPLAALPVILILGFVGCTLDRHGADIGAVTLVFPPGLNLSLVNMHVDVSAVGIGEEKPIPDTWDVDAVDIPPGGGQHEFSMIDLTKIDTSPDGGGIG